MTQGVLPMNIKQKYIDEIIGCKVYFNKYYKKYENSYDNKEIES